MLDSDLPAFIRIWREVGWIDDDDQEKALPFFLEGADALVATMEGEAECAVTTHAARMTLHDRDVPISVVSSVTTSRVARRQGFAGRLVAQALVAAAEGGAALSVLGMFDQGFYDRLGFGSGASMLRHQFDPSTMRVRMPTRAPVRLGMKDWAEIHAAMQGRTRSHGGVAMDSSGFTRGEMMWDADSLFALGFRDDAGTLTHLIWGKANGEHGPYEVYAFVHRSGEELLELLGLLRSLGDQVRVLWMPEPSEICLDDLLDRPHRHRFNTQGAKHPSTVKGGPWWQARILDVPATVGALSGLGRAVRCNVVLRDPLATHPEALWDVVDGTWIIEFGETSTAEHGHDDTLPTLTVDVGPFTRMLLGVAPASGLALTSELDGPSSLLHDLDRVLRLPEPNPGMYF